VVSFYPTGEFSGLFVRQFLAKARHRSAEIADDRPKARTGARGARMTVSPACRPEPGWKGGGGSPALACGVARIFCRSQTELGVLGRPERREVNTDPVKAWEGLDWERFQRGPDLRVILAESDRAARALVGSSNESAGRTVELVLSQLPSKVALA
jgi:hypothetical protein